VQVCDVIKGHDNLSTSFTSILPFYKTLEVKEKKQWIKGKTMAQWMNLHWNNSFVNWA